MNLVIDQGNSCSKIAVFKENTIVELLHISELTASELLPIVEKYHIKNTLFSSVAKTNSDIQRYLQEISENYLSFSENMQLPIKIKYKTPETLGKDRIAAVVGAYTQCPNQNLLVIDAGTCITYEEVMANGDYLGGNITPGFEMRLQSLHTGTELLPKVKAEETQQKFGFDTKSAILAGVYNGILFEINGFINEMQKKYPHFCVFLTGGDTFFFEKRLKNRIFAVKNLVLIGLNRILNDNV